MMEDMKRQAKLNVLQKLKQAASEKMKGGLKDMSGMKKVSVMSDSPEGLKAGLDKAEDVVDESEDVLKPEVSKVDAILEDLSDEECMELQEKLMKKLADKEEMPEEAEDEEDSNPFADM